MNTLISFRKLANKPPVFVFRRSDGSTTWSPLGKLPIEHDLAHYAVEKTLRFRQAFFGLLDQGYNTGDFERLRSERPVALLAAHLPLEALQTEHLVGRLQTELLCGPNTAFIDDLKEALKQRELTYPAQLTADKLTEIRNLLQNLIRQWRALPPGDQLDLPLVIP